MAARLVAALSIRQSEGEVHIGVRVSPSARKTRFQGVYGDRIKVAVSAPPEGGRANVHLKQALAEWTALPINQVEVIAGRTGRDKVVAFKGLSEAKLRARMSALLEDHLSTGDDGVVGSEGSQAATPGGKRTRVQRDRGTRR